MCKDVFFITSEPRLTSAFVVDEGTIPESFKDHYSVCGDVFQFEHCKKDIFECKRGDIVHYDLNHREEPVLRPLDESYYKAIDDKVYEIQPVYRSTLVTNEFPDFLADIDLDFCGDYWILKTSRLYIKVRLGDYWIRDIDVANRYRIPIVSVIEKNNLNFDKYWRCDFEGNFIEKLADYDSRLNSFRP